MVEIGVFLLLAALAIGTCTLFIWIAGVPFGLDFSGSIGVAFASVFFLIPAFFTLRNVVRNQDKARMRVRVFEGLMAFGMLLFGAPLVVQLVAGGQIKSLGSICIAGLVLTIVGMVTANILEL